MKLRLLVLLSTVAFVTPLHAETLQQAMTKAYANNPALSAQRARLRAIDEQVPIAKSGLRPSADINADAGYAVTHYNNTTTDLYPRTIGVGVTQPLYTGGQVGASIGIAEKTVLAERANLRNAEQQLFLTVAQAFYDVVRDQAVLRLTKKQEDVLSKERQAASDRFRVGEATKTDTAQAESRLSGSTADRIQAEGNLAISQATYEKFIGNPPGILQYELANIATPASLDEALGISQKNHPQVIAAQYTEQAAEDNIDFATGALLPKVSLEASGSTGWDTGSTFAGRVDGAQILARLVVPLYQGGGEYARTREAKQTANQRRIEVHDAMDQVRQNTVRAWQQLVTARAAIKARRSQVNAAGLAYEGVKQESEVGTRTILDRLDAEAEALQAQVNLVQAERDQAVALFDVKAAVGELTAAQLTLPVTPYDPTQHYDEVKDKWIGLGSTGDSDADPVTTVPVGNQKSEGNPEVKTVIPVSTSTPYDRTLERSMGFN